MKKLAIFVFCCFFSLAAFAQMTTLNENFNASCPAKAPTYPAQWSQSCFFSPFDSMAWNCTPTNGRNGTGGVMCSAYFANASHLDTAYLITPELNISGYTGNVYLQFDTKASNISTVQLAFMPSRDSIINNADTPQNPVPALSAADVAGWTTHQVDITSFKSSPNFYFAFRYVSTATYAYTWYIDNVSLTGIQMHVPDEPKGTLPLAVLGNSSANLVTISFTPACTAAFNVLVYDMMGRELYRNTIDVQNTRTTYAIRDLNLHAGMYFIKVGNDDTYGVIKTIVQ